MSTTTINWQDVNIDREFIGIIRDYITINGMIPFTIPTDHLPLIIKQSARYFYKTYHEATESKWLVIKNEDIVKNGLNKSIKLPKDVEAVTKLETIGSNITSLRPYSYRPNILLTLGANFTSYLNGSFGGAQMNNIRDVEDIAIASFEIQQIQHLTRKFVNYKYNSLTNNLNILGDTNGRDIVLQVYTRIPIQDLYEDDNFLNHVLGTALVNMEILLSVVGFKMPGGVTINPATYEKKGQKLLDKIEKFMDLQDTNIIIAT